MEPPNITHSCTIRNRYDTEFMARMAGRRRFEDGAGDLWVYPCGYCGGWHLTSTPRVPHWHVNARTPALQAYGEITGDGLFWERLSEMPFVEAEQLLRLTRANVLATIKACEGENVGILQAFISRLNDEIHLLSQSEDKKRIWRAIEMLFGPDAVPAVRIELERMRAEDRA